MADVTTPAPTTPTFLQKHNIDFKAPWSKEEKIAAGVGGAIIIGAAYYFITKKKKKKR